MDETLENKRQAVKPYEPAGVVSVAFLHRTSWTGIFSVVREHQMGRNASGIFVCGCTDPGILLLLRQALDFTYREELLINTLSDYVEHVRTWVEEVPVAEKPNEAEKEEIVEHIAQSIRQTAAAGSHFSDADTGGRRNYERNHKRIYEINVESIFEQDQKQRV